MTSRATVLAVWLRPLVDYLESLGIDSRDTFEASGVDIDQVFVPGVRIPLAQAAPLWNIAAEAADRPFLALELVSFAPSLQADAVAIAMQASRNLYESLQRFARLSVLLCEGVELQLERDADDLRLSVLVSPPEQEVMSIEALEPALLPILASLDKGLLDARCIRCLEFERDYPGDEAYRYLSELLPVPMKFACSPLALVCDWELSLKDNPYWNPALAQAAETVALQAIERLDERNIVGRVQKLILELLPEGKPEQGRVAELLGLSPRHLQRGLEQKGVTWSDLLRQVRHELACQYLQDGHLSQVEVAMALGFGDQSNFTKAFKDWEGETPGQYRKRLQ